ncbi:uncharacterized protein TNCV_804431 [Trichonephila clavipes]|nr:uncharacterized protein TNCV_804431 [Trichonephila clavipes]
MGRYWISLSTSSSMHCRYFKQPALHLLGVGDSCPSLPSGLGHIHISLGHVARIVKRFFANRQIELLTWSARYPDLSPVENMWSMVA